MKLQLYNEIPEGKKLYHYTTIAGFAGMRSSKSLWFSHIKFQNDFQEFLYAVEIIKNVFSTVADERIKFPNHLHIVPDKLPVFTFSLSEEKDLLSQWRGYCPNGGFSVRIADGLLNHVIKTDPHLELGQCIYKKDKQEEMVYDTIIGPIIETLKQREYDRNKTYLKRPDYDFFLPSQILKVIPFIKHPAYEQESEWRIVMNLEDQNLKRFDENLDFRAGESSLIPFIKVPLGEYLQFQEIIVGPNPHQSAVIEACKMDRRLMGVQASDIPYRKL
jgi:hypothetical protein